MEPAVTTALDSRAGARAASTRTVLRTGTALVLAGVLAEYAVTGLHAHREQPNDHAAVFAEYAASDNWIAVHLGQFLAGGTLLAGVLVLLAGLRAGGAPALVTRVGAAATVLAGAVFAVLQGIDGVALKHAVESLAAAPPELHDAWFHDAEIVRWTEWAMAGYSQLTLGPAILVLGVAVSTSRALPRWTAGFSFVAAAGFLVSGVVVSYAGFPEDVLAGVTGSLALALFALTTAIAAWTGHRGLPRGGGAGRPDR
jgi:hypothetical protein